MGGFGCEREMNLINEMPTWVCALGLLVLMFVANEIGFRLSRVWNARESERSHSVSSSLKATIFGLVALLLGFSFSITSSRFQQRQSLVQDEANAIGTCYLRSGMLEEPHRGQIRQALRTYVDLRLEHFAKALNPTEFQRTTAEMNSALDDLWAGVAAGCLANHELARVSQIVPAANEVIDLSAKRAWTSQNHLPPSMLWLLGVCIVLSAGLTGHSSGQTEHRHVSLWIALNVLVLLVLYEILDFDRPRRGLIQVNHAPLVDVQKSLH